MNPLVSEGVLLFIECCLQQILYWSQIYPRSLFRESQAWMVRVWQCRHPAITDYLTEVMRHAGILLDDGCLRSLRIDLQGNIKISVEFHILNLIKGEEMDDRLAELFRSGLLRLQLTFTPPSHHQFESFRIYLQCQSPMSVSQVSRVSLCLADKVVTGTCTPLFAVEGEGVHLSVRILN